MPRGIPGSGPFAGRGKKSNGAKGRGRGRRSTTLAEVAARSGGAGQTASDGPKVGTARTATGKGRKSAGKTPGRGSMTASHGNQRAETESKTGTNNTGQNNGQTEVGGVKIETMPVPGRGGRPQQAEKFPFAALDVAVEEKDGSMVGPSFLIPEAENPDNILAAARKRHKGKTFMSRKMEGGVRIWRSK